MSGKKIYCFVKPTDPNAFDGSITIMEMDDEGNAKTYMLDDIRSLPTFKKNLNNDYDCQSKYIPVWVDFPNDHPGVVKALAKYEAKHEVKNEFEGLSEGDLAEIKGASPCDHCSHSTVCGVAIAVKQQEALGGLVVVSNCFNFQGIE